MINDKDMILNYFESLVDDVFKILPLYEEENIGLATYIESMIFNLNSLKDIIDSKNGYKYITILLILKSIEEEVVKKDSEKRIIKREVFKCINIIKDIINNLESSN